MSFFVLGKLKSRLIKACDWLADIAIKREDVLINEKNPKNLEQSCWKGAIKNEYIVAKKE